jgi:outer membrane protein TolC
MSDTIEPPKSLGDLLQANADIAKLDEEIAALKRRREQLLRFCNLGMALYPNPARDAKVSKES